MPYAILQKTLQPPSVDQLTKAFRSLPDLTASDAAIIAKDAFGILVGSLSFEQAETLSAALIAQGVDNEVVDEQHLFTLPPFKKLRQADCLPDHLLLYDPLDRPQNIDWSHVIVVAAGSVSLTEFKRTERQRVHYHMTPTGFGGLGLYPYADRTVSTKEEQQSRLILEIYLDINPIRSHADSREFRYNYLGPRLLSGSAKNFSLLVTDLAKYATKASLNRGAQTISQDPTKTFSYPSRHAFEEEIIWLLWKGGYQLKSQT